MLERFKEYSEKNLRDDDGTWRRSMLQEDYNVEIVEDELRDFGDFLRYYCVEIEEEVENKKTKQIEKVDVLKIRKEHIKEIDSVRACFFFNRIEKKYKLSFFTHAQYLTMFFLLPYQKEDDIEKKFVSKEVVERTEQVIVLEDDFLGLYNGYTTRHDREKNYERYFAMVNRDFSLKDKVVAYRRWMREHSLYTQISKIKKYDDPREFVYTFEKQFGFYYEVVHKLKRVKKDLKIFAPCDGVGAISIVCAIMDIPYFSTEPNDIGKIAVELAIITTSEHVYFPVNGDYVSVLCNLNSYLDYSLYVNLPFVIIDEDRLFKGVPLAYCKKSTYGKVYSNVIKEDNFSTMQKDFNKAYRILDSAKCVPLTSKAEYALIHMGKQVYNDGVVETITLSEYADKCLYVSSSNNGTAVKVGEIDLDVTPKYINGRNNCFAWCAVGWVHGISMRNFIRKMYHKHREFCEVRNVYYTGDRHEFKDFQCVQCVSGVDREKGLMIFEDIKKKMPPKAKILHYEIDIDIKNYEERVKVGDYRNFYGLNIITRGDPYNFKGTLPGQSKVLEDMVFRATGSEQRVTTNRGSFIIDIPPYKSSQELKKWVRLDDGSYAGECYFPNRIRYLIEDGVKTYLIYLHSLKKGGKIFAVFRDARSAQSFKDNRYS